jgi:hypothetical protein
MPRLQWCGVAALLLSVGLMTAGQARTEEAPANTPQGPASQTEAVAKTPSVSGEAATTPAAPQPAAKPPPKPARQAKPLERFRPSEEIHVDKAVDFPSDI